MGGRGLDTATTSEIVDSEIDEGRVHHPHVDDMGAKSLNPRFQGVGQSGRRLTHITTDDNVSHHRVVVAGICRLLREKLGGRIPDLPGEPLIEGLWIDGPHVICLEYLAEHG